MKGAVFCLLLLVGPVLSTFAQELTPLEKALHALAQKEENGMQTEGTTSAARAVFWTPVQDKGSTTTASTTTPESGSTFLNAQQTLSQAQRFMLDMQQRMNWAGDIYPFWDASNTHTAQSDPFGLTATATAEMISLTWSNTGTAYKNFTGYLIRKAGSGETMQPVSSMPSALTTYQDATVTAKTLYVYQVTALGAQGQTLAASWPISLRLAPALPPNAPRELQISIHEERIQLKWNPPLKTSHAVQGYIISRFLTTEGEWEALNNTPVAKVEYYDETGRPGVSYDYQVVTVDSRGVTSASSTTVTGYARFRSRNGLILLSTAYRGMGREDTGFTGDMQFTYYIGTLYGEQAEELSLAPLYLDPISLWLLSADAKYTFLTETQAPVSAAIGGKGSVLLFAGQQSSSGGQFTFSDKSELDWVWGGYLSFSKSFGGLGVHGGYLLGSMGDPILYLSKYMRYGETERTRNLFYVGLDFPIVRRMNTSMEIIYPLDAELVSQQHPVLVNLHVDRLFNFDVSYLHWDQGWAFLGYFNIRFTIYPGSWK